MKQPMIVLALLLSVGGAYGGEVNAETLLRLESVYSRGNDDFGEANHETAKITLDLVVKEQLPNKIALTLNYSAKLSVEHPHNLQGDSYWLKQRFNEAEPNLTASKFTYIPGPSGKSVGAEIKGSLFLGELDRSKVGPYRGRVVVTLAPDYDPNSPIPVDSWIDWGIQMADQKPTNGNLSLHAQWKGLGRPAEEMIRLISSNFVEASALRPPFPQGRYR